MSKKETEFDRFDRMRKMEREVEAQKKKNVEYSDDLKNKKGGKLKSGFATSKRNWVIERDYEEEYV